MKVDMNNISRFTSRTKQQAADEIETLYITSDYQSEKDSATQALAEDLF